MDWNEEMDAAFDGFLRTDPTMQKVIGEIKDAVDSLRKRDNLPARLPFRIITHGPFCWVRIDDEAGNSHIISVRA